MENEKKSEKWAERDPFIMKVDRCERLKCEFQGGIVLVAPLGWVGLIDWSCAQPSLWLARMNRRDTAIIKYPFGLFSSTCVSFPFLLAVERRPRHILVLVVNVTTNLLLGIQSLIGPFQWSVIVKKEGKKGLEKKGYSQFAN